MGDERHWLVAEHPDPKVRSELCGRMHVAERVCLLPIDHTEADLERERANGWY